MTPISIVSSSINYSGTDIIGYLFNISESDYNLLLTNSNYNFLKFSTNGVDFFEIDDLFSSSVTGTTYGIEWSISNIGGFHIYFSALNFDDVDIFNPTSIVSFSAALDDNTGFVTTPNLFKGFLFTLNRDLFTITTAADNTYFQFDCEVKVYDNNQETTFITYNLKNKLIPFNGKATIEIGSTIHQLINRFLENIYQDEYLYKAVDVVITCSEIAPTLSEVIRTQVLDTIKFIAGFDKSNFIAGFLMPNKLPESITKKGFKTLNFYIQNNLYHLKVFKNSEYQETILFTEDEFGVVSKQVTFEDYNQGDKIEYVFDLISNSTTEDSYNEDAYIKTFYVLPEQNYSNMIIWEDLFSVQSAHEFRGAFALPLEVEQITQKVIKNFVEITEVLTSTNNYTFKINTGWILQSDIHLIISLINSKKAWIYNELTNTKIEIIPISKAITPFDTEKALIDYTLEFKVNKQYNEENYSF